MRWRVYTSDDGLLGREPSGINKKKHPH